MVDGSDVRWMTYAELGRARGISTASATRLAFRRKWQRQPGNNGIARVAVPASEAKPRGDKAHDDSGNIARLVRSLTTADTATSEREQADVAAISVLREQLKQANSRAEADAALIATLQDQLGQAHDRAERAQVSTYVLRDQVDELQNRLAAAERARDDALQAQQAAEHLRRAESASADARVRAQTARVAADALRQADDAWKALGFLARLKQAWRGE